MNGTRIGLFGSVVLFVGLCAGPAMADGFDLDGDGIPELLVRDEKSGEVSVIVFEAEGLEIPVFAPGFDSKKYQFLCCTHLEGETVVLWRNKKSGEVVGWLLSIESLSELGLIAVPLALESQDTAWELVCCEEYAGEDTEFPVLIWKHKKTRAMEVWLVIVDGGPLGTVFRVPLPTLDRDWEILGCCRWIEQQAGQYPALLLRNKKTGELNWWVIDIEGPTAVVLPQFIFVQSEGEPVVDTRRDELVCCGDLLGDGIPDLIWSSRNSDTFVFWFTEGFFAPFVVAYFEVVSPLLVNPLDDPAASETPFKVVEFVGCMCIQGQPYFVWRITVRDSETGETEAGLLFQSIQSVGFEGVEIPPLLNKRLKILCPRHDLCPFTES